MARHSLGSIVALSSDIESWVFVTVISVAPITLLTCSGLSSNPGSAVSATGGGVVDMAVDVVVDVLVAWFPPTPHPAVRQMPTTASAAVRWRMCSPPVPRTSKITAILPRAYIRRTMACGGSATFRGASSSEAPLGSPQVVDRCSSPLFRSSRTGTSASVAVAPT